MNGQVFPAGFSPFKDLGIYVGNPYRLKIRIFFLFLYPAYIIRDGVSPGRFSFVILYCFCCLPLNYTFLLQALYA